MVVGIGGGVETSRFLYVVSRKGLARGPQGRGLCRRGLFQWRHSAPGVLRTLTLMHRVEKKGGKGREEKPFIKLLSYPAPSPLPPPFPPVRRLWRSTVVTATACSRRHEPPDTKSREEEEFLLRTYRQTDSGGF